MDRRTFITRFPLLLGGGAMSMLAPGREETPERQELRGLLEQATRLYEQARHLLHTPHRYAEARPLLEAALGDAAQAWLRLRGITGPQGHHDWTFNACNIRDRISGVAWNQASVACRLLRQHCDHMGRWMKESPGYGDTRSITRQRAREELLTALDAVSQCIECARHALLGLTGPLPPIP